MNGVAAGVVDFSVDNDESFTLSLKFNLKGASPLNNHKLTPKKSYEIVTEHIKNQIEQGELKPGDRLDSVVQLASQYGFGRSTIREALGALKAMGWLDIRHGGGTFVKTILPEASDALSLFNRSDSLSDLLEVRKILETQTAHMAALRRNEDQLKQMENIIEQMSRTLDDEELAEQADVRFHMEIAKSSQNLVLYSLMESLSQRLQQTIRDTRTLWLFGEAPTANRLLQEHINIFQAIDRQEADLASSLMYDHITRVEDTLTRIK